MNEREFLYSEPDAADSATPSPEAVTEHVVTPENAAPVAPSSMATTDPQSDAPEAAPVQPATETPVAESPVAEAPAEAQLTSEPAATDVPAAEASAPDAPADVAQTESTESAAAPEAPASKKQPAVVITDEVLAKIRAAKDGAEIVDVQVTERVKGGLRVTFEGVKMFLPSSQFFAKKTPTDDELQSVVGQTIKAIISEIQSDDTGKISFIVSRKNILKKEFFANIKVGDIVEGTVSSIMPFGVFVDIGGVDALLHISRISHQRVEDPNTMFKKGDSVKAKVIEIDANKDKISLNRKALEDSPWTTVETDFTPGMRVKGIVKRFADFGAFVELKHGVEGLLRMSELSWTKRIGNVSELFTVGQEIEVQIVDSSSEKKQIGLSTRRLEPNPWTSVMEKFPVGAETTGVVQQVMASGAVITVGGEFDGFMPRSKMRTVMRGKRIPYNVGDMVSVVVADANADDASLIFEPKVDPTQQMFGSERTGGGGRKRDGDGDGDRGSRNVRVPKESNASDNTNFSLMDLLSDNEKQNLFNNSQSSN
ncbi:MAG: S1 RNA-binding domain-containing protein [Candidatus Kapabacteria bacterium]|nr:S1 RNA-binding domain-containing protein [Candidatus Kapabacteria bacterium]